MTDIKEPKVKTDTMKASSVTKEQVDSKMQLAVKLMNLEHQVTAATLSKCEWLEVDEDVITHFTQGKFPEARYVIYKNIRLCLENESDEIARKENMTVFQTLHKEDAKQFSVNTSYQAIK